MHSIALIKREDSKKIWGPVPKVSSYQQIVGISIQELATQYQGFEGYIDLMFPVRERSPRFRRRLQTCINYVKQGDHILLHVLDGCSVMSPAMQQQAEKMGYDVGKCIPDCYAYSSIWQEIILGEVDELIAYKKFLNEHFLFSNRMRARQYLALQGEMERQGKRVEHHDMMKIHEVWKHKIDMSHE